MFQRTMLKSKIHRATVTDANLNYEGSVSIDTKLIEAVENEKVEIYNCNNGERFATYVIPGKTGEICLNGAAARKAQPGDLVIIASYIQVNDDLCHSHKPQLVFVDAENKALAYHLGS